MRKDAGMMEMHCRNNLLKRAYQKASCEETIESALRAEGVHVLAVGPSACLRVLFFRALNINRISKITLLPLSHVQILMSYHLLQIEEIIKGIFNNHLQSIKGVVLYISCADIMMATDFDGLLNGLEEKYGVPIKVFRRGPLVKRYSTPKTVLKEIIDKMPDFSVQSALAMHGKDAHKKANGFEQLLPPLSPDYMGAISILHGLGGITILVTPGGCIHNVTEVDEIRPLEDTLLFHTTYDDLKLATGLTDHLVEQITSMGDAIEKAPFVALVRTQTIYMSGVQLQEVGVAIKQITEKPVFIIETNGFEDYRKGMERVLKVLLETVAEQPCSAVARVNVFGYSPLELGIPDHPTDLIEFFHNLGIVVNAPEIQGYSAYERAGEASLTVCLSEATEEFARSLQARFHIPYVMGWPVGRQGMMKLCDALKNAFGDRIDQDALQKHRDFHLEANSSEGIADLKQMKKACLFDDTLLHRAIGESLIHDFGIPTSLIGDIDSFQRASLEEGTVFIADPLIRIRYDPDNVMQWIELPYGGRSGRFYMNNVGSYYGRKGYENIRNLLKESVGK